MASEYQYLTTAEYASYDLAVSGITNEALAEKHVSHAEKMVDVYCGFWHRFYPRLTGVPSAVNGAVVTAGLFGGYAVDYWAKGGLYLVVYDGGGAGEQRLITASNDAGEATLVSGISGLTTASKFVLRQLSVFPRAQDVDAADVPYIPERVKLATAAQVSFAVQSGSEGAGLWHPEPALGAKGQVISETYGSGYSYQRNPALAQGIAQFLSPQARAILHGLRRSTGRIPIGR
jgi:hypothetical protein